MVLFRLESLGHSSEFGVRISLEDPVLKERFRELSLGRTCKRAPVTPNSATGLFRSKVIDQETQSEDLICGPTHVGCSFWACGTDRVSLVLRSNPF